MLRLVVRTFAEDLYRGWTGGGLFTRHVPHRNSRPRPCSPSPYYWSPNFSPSRACRLLCRASWTIDLDSNSHGLPFCQPSFPRSPPLHGIHPSLISPHLNWLTIHKGVCVWQCSGRAIAHVGSGRNGDCRRQCGNTWMRCYSWVVCRRAFWEHKRKWEWEWRGWQWWRRQHIWTRVMMFLLNTSR